MMLGLVLLAVTPVKSERPIARQSYICAGMERFEVRLEGDRATVTTDGGQYELRERRSSIGRKFLSEDVAFISDGNSGVLVGAAGGAFRSCLLAASR